MFGRRKREEAAAEAVREAERHALFARLAERPEHICPFLGLAAERTGYVEGVSDEHRCYAFGDPTSLSAEQQTRVCQERGYGNCPRYLRGVLVIPTEELEALRRPHAPLPVPVAPPPSPPDAERRRRGGPILLLLAALLLLVGGVGAFLVFGDRFGVAVVPTSSSLPSPSPSASAGPTTSIPGSPLVTPSPTPFVLPSASAFATPAPGSEQIGHVVVVTAGTFPAIRMNQDGTPGEESRTIFDRRSGAPVERVEVDGTTYWVTLVGDYTGLAYVAGLSGDFRILEVWESPEGEIGFIPVPEDER